MSRRHAAFRDEISVGGSGDLRDRSGSAERSPARPRHQPLSWESGEIHRELCSSTARDSCSLTEDVAEETNRRFGNRLRDEVGSRTASDVLRRMLAQGEVKLVRKGKAFHEALYRRS